MMDWELKQSSKTAPTALKTLKGLSLNLSGGVASEGTAGGENAGMFVDIYIYIYRRTCT